MEPCLSRSSKLFKISELTTMKKILIIIIGLMLTSAIQPVVGQTINWNSVDNFKNVINLGFGWDYSVSYQIAYARRLNTKMPVALNASFAIPAGENRVDDFKTKMGGQLVILNNENYKGIVTINGIFRRYESPLVRLHNFGSELKGSFGYYHAKWFLSAELGFDKAIVTHVKHAKSYKDNVYAQAVEGWYEPATGGNYMLGLQTGVSFKKSDLTLNLGVVKTQDLKSSPLIPFYLMLGYNFRLN